MTAKKPSPHAAQPRARRWHQLLHVGESLAHPGPKDELCMRAMAGFVPHLASHCAFDLLEDGAWERLALRAGAARPDGRSSAGNGQLQRQESPLGAEAPPALTALMDVLCGVSTFDADPGPRGGRTTGRATRRAVVGGRRRPHRGAAPPFAELLCRLAGKPAGKRDGAILALPLRAGSEFLGVITLVRARQHGAWDAEERACAQLLASQAAMALSCMRMHNAAMQAHAETMRLRRVAASACTGAEAFAAAKNPAEALEMLAQHALEALADGCVIHFCGGPEGRKLVVAHADMAAAAHLRQRLTDQPLALLALQRPHRPGCQQPPKFTVPLLLAGVLRGHVTFLRDAGRPAFAEEDRALAGAFARRACEAIGRAWLAGELASAVRVRDAFISMASHELRTPLAALQLSLGSLRRLAERGRKDTVERTRVLDKASRSLGQTERLTRLIDTLLQAARGESGSRKKSVRTHDFTALCQKVVAQMQDEAKRAGCTLTLQAPGPILGRWDGRKLRQAVAHLLSNALKYGEKKPVTLILSKHADGVLLRVKDRGIGLAPQASPRIFDRFERDVSAHAFGGLGLGLHLARQIVRAHGGRIRAQRLATGTQFEIFLPYGAAKKGSLPRICGRDQEKLVNGCSRAAPTA